MVRRPTQIRARVERILNFSREFRPSAGSRMALVAGVSLLLLAGAVVPTKAGQVYRIGGDVIAP